MARSSGPLKLLARDQDDLRIIAACLQDALVPLTDVLYQRREKRFVMVANRFRWEALDPEAVLADVVKEAEAAAMDAASDGDESEAGASNGASDDAADSVPEGGAEGGSNAGSSDPESDDARFEDADAQALYERVNCGVRIEKVARVRVRNLEPGEKDQILSLLTVEAEPKAVTLHFSGGGAIRIETTEIACVLEDLGEPWPTSWRPSHRLDETADAD